MSTGQQATLFCGKCGVYHAHGEHRSYNQKTPPAVEYLRELQADRQKLTAENAELRAAMKALVDDEWRCTVDWGSREEREAILERCRRLVP